MIHVCSLAALPETVKATGASHILTVMANVDQVQRPESVLEANHLKVQVDDITEEIEGFVAPCDTHIEQVLNFVRGWDRAAPLVVHCYRSEEHSLNSSHANISYAVFCLKKKKKTNFPPTLSFLNTPVLYFQ